MRNDFDFRIEHEKKGWHPWTVYMRLCPIGFFERVAERCGWRRELWLQVFSADTPDKVADFILVKLTSSPWIAPQTKGRPSNDTDKLNRTCNS